MKIASVADVKSRLSAYLKESEQGPVVVTRNGKAVAVLLAVTDEDELERLILAYSPKFQAILGKSRRQIEEGGGIAHDDFWAGVNREGKRDKLDATQMTKQVAIATINERGRDTRLTSQNTHFAKINARKNVWWIEIPFGKVFGASTGEFVHFALYDQKNGQLHHLAVPAEYLSKNHGHRRLVSRDEKQVLVLELSPDSFADERPKGGKISFAQFRL